MVFWNLNFRTSQGYYVGTIIDYSIFSVLRDQVFTRIDVTRYLNATFICRESWPDCLPGNWLRLFFPQVQLFVVHNETLRRVACGKFPLISLDNMGMIKAFMSPVTTSILVKECKN